MDKDPKEPPKPYGPPNLYPKPSEMTEDEKEIGELMWAVMMETRWGSPRGFKVGKRPADVLSKAVKLARTTMDEEDAETSDPRTRAASKKTALQQFAGAGDDGPEA